MLRRLAENSDNVLVALSGGKDSLVVLDLCKRSGLFKRVEAYYLYMVKGLEFFEKPVRVAAARHKVTVHMAPHPALAYALRTGECRLHVTHKVPRVTQVDVELALRVRTGIGWLALGHRMTDSLHRRGMLHRCSGFDAPGRRVYPIWDWAPCDVHSYLRARRIPIPVPLRPSMRSNGFDLRPKTLAALRERAPRDYAKVLAIFPFAEAQLFAIVNRRTGNIVSGHQRLAAIDVIEGRGDYDLDVAMVDLSDIEERTQNVFMNNGAAMGAWDTEMLEALLRDIDKDALADTGFDAVDLSVVFNDDRLAPLFADSAQPAEVVDALHEIDNIASVADNSEERARAKAKKDAELAAIKEAKKDARESAKEVDSECYAVVVFRDRAEQTRFVTKCGVDPSARYVDGAAVWRLLGE